jgi:hypothetical protein
VTIAIRMHHECIRMQNAIAGGSIISCLRLNAFADEILLQRETIPFSPALTRLKRCECVVEPLGQEASALTALCRV